MKEKVELDAIRDLENMTSALLSLGQEAPERMTLSQVLFFLTVATQNSRGETPTFGSVKDAVGEELNRSLHTTYRILMAPSRAFPKGLGWLKAEINPEDNRQKFLSLTKRGDEVFRRTSQCLSARPRDK